MERKQIQFTPSQIRAIRAEARRQRTSDAAVVRQAIDAVLGRKRPAIARGRAERALAAVGRFASGRRDVSREHDRELADALRR